MKLGRARNRETQTLEGRPKMGCDTDEKLGDARKRASSVGRRLYEQAKLTALHECRIEERKRDILVSTSTESAPISPAFHGGLAHIN
jgi:hypothetical protein